MELPLPRLWKEWNAMSNHVKEQNSKFRNTIDAILSKIDLMSPELWKYHPYPWVFKKNYHLSFSYFMMNSTTDYYIGELVVLLTKRKRSIILVWIVFTFFHK